MSVFGDLCLFVCLFDTMLVAIATLQETG